MEKHKAMANKKEIESFKKSNGFNGNETSKDLMFHILHNLETRFETLDRKLDDIKVAATTNDINTALACERSEQNRYIIYAIILGIVSLAIKIVFFQ